MRVIRVGCASVLIAEAVDLVVYLARRASGRRVEEIIRLRGLEGRDYRIESLDPHP